jgi:hypothetical protein
VQKEEEPGRKITLQDLGEGLLYRRQLIRREILQPRPEGRLHLPVIIQPFMVFTIPARGESALLSKFILLVYV